MGDNTSSIEWYMDETLALIHILVMPLLGYKYNPYVNTAFVYSKGREHVFMDQLAWVHLSRKEEV
jgi:hypothetical protein